MREFFRGWRRKAGLATLAMALLLMTGWMRSYVIRDVVCVWASQSVYSAISVHGGVLLSRSTDDDITQPFDVDWDSADASLFSEWSLNNDAEMDLFCCRCGFFVGVCSYRNVLGHPRVSVIFSYSLFVQPLTLISAWLLLIKPRPAKSAKESSHA